MTTVTDPTTGPIVKSDRTGRTRYTADYKCEVLTAFASSCLSAPQFARQCGIKYPTFASWLAAGKRGDRPAADRSPSFLLAEVPAASDRTALEIHLPGGAVARASDANQIRLLAQLLRHLV